MASAIRTRLLGVQCFSLLTPIFFFYLLWDDMIHKTPDEVVIFRPSIVDMVVTSMECCVRNGFFFSFFFS